MFLNEQGKEKRFNVPSDNSIMSHLLHYENIKTAENYRQRTIFDRFEVLCEYQIEYNMISSMTLGSIVKHAL